MIWRLDYSERWFLRYGGSFTLNAWARLSRAIDAPKSVLRVAGELGHRGVCERLVRAGADVNEISGARKFSLLHSAAATSNFGFASILLDLGADPNAKASNDSTPLHIAARSGQEYLAKTLLRHHAAVDCQDSLGRTPLHWAVEKNDFDMASLLTKKGCRLDLADRSGRTPLSIALANGNSKIKDLLVLLGAEMPPPNHSSQVNRVAENQPPDQQKLF